MTLEQWERASEWPLIVVPVLFLAAYSAQVLASESMAQVTGWFMMTTWALFLIDYGVSLWLAPRRLNWFFRHLHELVIVVLPMLRPLRLLRLVTLIGVLQRVAGNALRGRVVTYVIAASGLLTYIGALAMYDTEKNRNGGVYPIFRRRSLVGHSDHHNSGLRRPIPSNRHWPSHRRRTNDRWHRITWHRHRDTRQLASR